MTDTSPKLNRRHAVGALLGGASLLATDQGRLFAQDSHVAPSPSSGNNSPASTQSDRVWAVGMETGAHRARLMRDLMDGEQFDALVFTSGLYLKFAANFNDAWDGEGVCVVPRNGDAFLLLPVARANAWRYQLSAHRPWTTDVTFLRGSDRLEDVLSSKLQTAGLGSCKVGVEKGLNPLFKNLPKIRVQQAARRIDGLRLTKSEEEVAVMREAASLADWIQARYRENIRPGRLVGELDAAIAALGYQEAARRFPNADVSVPCWTLSGPISASPHGAGTSFGNLSGARIESGHVLINNVYPSLDGLGIENERTWICGKPSRRQADLFEAVVAAQQAACEAVVAGNMIAAIDAAALTVFERFGFAEMVHHRAGHGLGLGGHDEPIDMAFNTDPIPERMVTSVEPSLLEYGLGGFRIDDTVVAGKTPDLLTRSPKDLKSQTIS
jgi:Xaa-Pro aminopeptidase